MEIPEKVKIGWKEFKVTVTEPSIVLKSDNGDYYGDIYWDKSEIRLSSNNDDDQQQATLIHEILHGISDMFNLDLSEDTVLRLGNALYTVIKDNPELFE